ncbi:MAG: hypothetical protein IRY99_23550, partial [Isosphaeraceae bacterium]|nr:hypothetical protein [Isosphaeraceae bacterium]
MRRPRILRWATALIVAALGPTAARGQVPVSPTGPAPPVPERRVGPLRRFYRHTSQHLQSKFIGYPEYFCVPPLGASIGETFGVMRAKADPHKFTLYRSDFVDGTDVLTPAGAQRLTLLAARLPGWLGPVTIEWTPDRPGLDAARRTAVLAKLQGAGLPVVAERVVVGPSPYPGLPGADATNNYDNLIFRDQRAPRTYMSLKQ